MPKSSTLIRHDHPITDIDYTIPLDVWVVPGWSWGTGAAPNWVAGLIAYAPIFCSQPMEFDGIGIQVVVGSAGTARMGIYNGTIGTTQNRLGVGSLLLDAGTVDVTTSGSKIISITATTLHGYYFLAIVMDSTPTIQTPDTAAHGFVNWANNDVNGTFDHFIPIATGQSALVAGGLGAPVTPSASATVLRMPVRLRLV